MEGFLIPPYPNKYSVLNQALGVILYAPNAAPPMAANISRISINLWKEQQVQPQMSQQMLSQVGSCVHFFHA